MKFDAEKILERANQLYAEAKMPDKSIYAAPESLPQIQSDQVKCALKAIVEALNNEPTGANHDWSEIFSVNICRICAAYVAPAGQARAEHARKHVREGKAQRIGDGSRSHPFVYKPTR